MDLSHREKEFTLSARVPSWHGASLRWRLLLTDSIRQARPVPDGMDLARPVGSTFVV